MKRNLITILILVVAISIVMVFAAAKALAFSDDPCYGWNYDCQTCVSNGCVNPHETDNDIPRTLTNSSGWSVQFVKIDQVDVPPNWWRWHYRIWNNSTQTASGLNVAAWLIPDCCKSPKIGFHMTPYQATPLSSPSNLTYYDPAAPEPSSGFGKWIRSAFVVRGTPAGADWYLVANTNHKTISTLFLKLKSSETSFEIEVPGCTPAPVVEAPPIGGRTYSECVNSGQDTVTPIIIPGYPELPPEADDVSFYIVRNSDRDGCIQTMWACKGHNCPNCTSLSCEDSTHCQPLNQVQPDSNTILQGSLLRSCPDENFSITMGSPYYLYTWNSGGVLQKKCLNLNYQNPSVGAYFMPTLDCCLGAAGCP